MPLHHAVVNWQPNRAVLAAATLLAVAAPARAQAVYTEQIVYGDSYADNGNLVNGGFFNPSQPYPRSVTTNVGFLTFLVYPTSLQSLLGISDSGMADYAFGGATTGPGVPGLILGYQQQIDESLALGQHFGPRALVTINIGGNDGGASTGGLTVAQAPGVAATASTNLANGVGTLVGAGARNFMISTFDDVSVIPNVFNDVYGPGAIAADKLYGSLFFPEEEAKLAPYAQAGARIFTFDLSQFAREVDASPATYGFTNVLKPCANTPACATPTSPGQFTNATFDGLHLTTGGFLYVARYMANLLEAPASFPAEADLAQSTTADFATSLFGRLDGYRDPATPAPTQPVSLYAEINGAGSTRDGRLDATGYHYDAAGGSIGIEYVPMARVRLGLAFDYSTPSADLSGGAGHFDVDSAQFAGYASVSDQNWFTDIALIYGRSDFAIRRPGVVDTITADTSADSISAAARAAYLVPAGPVELGPLVGLAYSNSRVGAYTEQGDPLLTFAIGPQTVDSLTGSAGVQLRAPMVLGETPIRPYLDLTAEHDFLRGNETLSVTETQSPVLPILTSIDGPSQHPYGKVQGGVSAAFGERFTLVVSAASTFERASGDGFSANAGLMFRF